MNLQSPYFHPEFHPAPASDPPGHFHRHHCYRDHSGHPLDLSDHLWDHPGRL